MLKITKYYKTIFLWFIQSNIVSVEGSTTFLDDFSKSDNKTTFLKDNATDLISYLQKLDSNKEWILSLSDKSIMHHIVSHDNPKLKDLFKQIWINDTELMSWINLQEIINKLTDYKQEKTETIWITTKKVWGLHNVINTSIILQSKTSLKLWSEWQAVWKLQEFLIKKWFLKWKIDLDFWPKTSDALKKYQKESWFKDIDWILTVKKDRNGKYFPTMQSILESEGLSPSNISERTASSDDILNAWEKADKSIDANIDKIKKSKEFYKALEAREDWWYRGDILSDTWSVFWLLKEVFQLNKASEYFEKIKGYEKVLQNPEMIKRFNEWYEFLVKDSSTRNSSLLLYWFRDVLMTLFVWIPLFDVRINFVKSLQKSGIDMRRATIFSKWAESGMKQSFEKYEKEVWPTINTWEDLDKDLNMLKGTITAYITSKYGDKIKNTEINQELINKLRKTDKKLDELITIYIDSRFIPDAETLLAWWFNWFESISDDKYDIIKTKINILNWWEIKLETKNKARKNTSSSEDFKDVFLLKNNGKFYLHIWSEYKEFDKKPNSKEIESSILEYNKLSLTTSWKNTKKHIVGEYPSYSIKGKKIIAEAKKKGIAPDLTITQKENPIWLRLDLNKNQNETYLLKWDRLILANEIISELEKQNIEWVANLFWQWNLTQDIVSVSDRLDYFSALNNKNSKFLKSAISILKSEKWISNDLKKVSWIINFYNGIDDFLNAYQLPKEVASKIKELNYLSLTPKEYVNKLKELNTDSNIKKAFDAISNWPNSFKEYKLKILSDSVSDVPKWSRIDAGGFKYWARMLTEQEFNMPYQDLQAEYKNRFDNKTEKQKFKQEFKAPKTFKSIYSFEKPTTYKEYLTLLSKTWPNLPDEVDNKYWPTVKLWTRGIIEAWIYNVTWEQVMQAIKDHWEAVDINDYFKNPWDFINTARQAWYERDKNITFEELAAERWDKKIIHTTIDREFSFTTISWENITRKVVYDVYMRPECENIYILPNSKSIQNTITTLKQNNAVSILNTPSIPVWLFSLLSNWWTNWLISNWTIPWIWTWWATGAQGTWATIF